MPSLSQTKAIHAAKRAAGLTDEDYRALLQGKFGVASSRVLDNKGANLLLDELRTLGGGGKAGGQAVSAAARRRRAQTATGKFAPILQALWIAGYNVGVVRSKDDAALIAFVQRQCKVDHTKFLTDQAQARRAIEALKSWLAREGGVEWTLDKKGDPDEGGRARKLAVCKAIAKRLQAEGAFTPFIEGRSIWPVDIEIWANRGLGLPAGFEFYQFHHFDELANRMGARLRAALAKKSRSEPKKEAA